MNPIVIKGNLLYDSVTKKRFYIKGVTYDPIPNCIDGSTDVLADDYPENDWVEGHQWVDWRSELEDIVKMNVNTIRIYQVDPHKTHAKFMEHAQSLGLYVVVPLTGSNFGKLDAQQPSPGCYSDSLGSDLLWFARSVTKEFSQYPNTLMLAAGNELYLWSNSGHSFPCLKALVRDLHSWQTGCGATMRRVPIVYAMQDRGDPAREYIGDYLTSMKESEDDVIDIFGINAYVYCQDFWPWDADSPLYQLNEVYKHYAAPFVITEFGCQVNGVDSRKYNMVDQMMNEMQETVSGGLVYEYSQHVKPWDDKGFGLVETMSSTCDSNTQRTWYANAYALQAKYNASLNKSFRNAFGAWTDSDRCTWTPPAALHHARPEFPWNIDWSSFDWNYHNWNDALPPTPQENPSVECPSYDLSVEELRENECYGAVVLEPSPLPSASLSPSSAPSAPPSRRPTRAPSPAPSEYPSPAPVHAPTLYPSTWLPSPMPSHSPIAPPFFEVQSERSPAHSPMSAASTALIVLCCLLFAAAVAAALTRFVFKNEGRSKSKTVTEILQCLRRAGLFRNPPKDSSGNGNDGIVRRLVPRKPRHNSSQAPVGARADVDAKRDQGQVLEMKRGQVSSLAKLPAECGKAQSSDSSVVTTRTDYV